MRKFETKITKYNEWFNLAVSYCIKGLPIEYSFGYMNIALSKDFPSWAKLTKSSDVDYKDVYTTLWGYFTGDKVVLDGNWNTVGTVQVDYSYRLDFMHPVSRQNSTENLFWERVEEFLNRFRNFDYRVIFPENEKYLSSLIIKPPSAVFTSPYIEFANVFCHYASYEIEIVDIQPYGSIEGRLR